MVQGEGPTGWVNQCVLGGSSATGGTSTTAGVSTALSVVIVGTLTLEMNATDAAAFVDAAQDAPVQDILKSGIAGGIKGMNASMVEILSVTLSSRRLGRNSRQLTTAFSIQVRYRITVPPESDAAALTAETIAAAGTVLTTSINTALADAGQTFTVIGVSAEAAAVQEGTQSAVQEGSSTSGATPGLSGAALAAAALLWVGAFEAAVAIA